MQTTHDIVNHRFIIDINDAVAELVYEQEGSTLHFTHTFVPKPLEGQGIGRALMLGAIDYLRDEGLTMVPVCPYVIAYAKKNYKTLSDLLPSDFSR